MQLNNSAFRRAAGAVALTTSLAVVAASGTPATAGPQANGAASPANANSSKALRKAVTKAGVAKHLERLQAIAERNDGSRASGTPGYKDSRDYLVRKLRKAGYHPDVQRFDFAFFREVTPATLAQVTPAAVTYDNPEDFTVMTYSAASDGDATGKVVPVDTSVVATDASTSGCEAADFAGFIPGDIALMQRGACAFGDKVENAGAAGAAGAIIFNRGTEGATDAVAGTLGAPGSIPAVGASFALAEELTATAGTTAKLGTDTESEIRPTWNVTAETRRGRADNVVMTGAHLDSVIDGAGINDNGSGSAALLEIARKIAKVKGAGRLKNQVRFAWWGAEELGLLGSEHYIADLVENNPGALEDIALYLNFDMIGSPNFARFIYDGDNSKFGEAEGAANGPAGSGDIEKTFRRYFRGQKLASAQTPFSGRSDYGPFIAEGIPAGGLFTGAEGVKTAKQQDKFGGKAGVAYDVCYHAPCDDISNVSMKAMRQMSDAAAHAIWTYAKSTKSLADVRAAKPSTGRSGAKPGTAELHPEHEEALTR